MTSRWRWMAICFGLAAWFWCTGGAFAQEGPVSAQPEDAGRPAVAAASSGTPWNTIEWVERRYKVEALQFKCREESGIGWWGSDEVMVETTDAEGWTVSAEIGNIDSGDSHRFDQATSCIISVRPGIVILGSTSVCDDVGKPAPFWFQVEFWEKDPIGYPTGFCSPGMPPDGHSGPHCANDGNGDDFLGRVRVEAPTYDLEVALPEVGDKYVESVVLDPCGGGICTPAADYTFTYRITRLPDVRVGLRSVLDEAMQRSGARSELEAITAGLRSLRAPSPRNIQSETANLGSRRYQGKMFGKGESDEIPVGR